MHQQLPTQAQTGRSEQASSPSPDTAPGLTPVEAGTHAEPTINSRLLWWGLPEQVCRDITNPGEGLSETTLHCGIVMKDFACCCVSVILLGCSAYGVLGDVLDVVR